ncbi:MAG: thioredoxin domain-containing protein [Candidatus Heimdallarchaeota archaeon]|nr:thioredoxin domain-containing protein [Candidatus Heimdallarchaeota archaeon]
MPKKIELFIQTKEYTERNTEAREHDKIIRHRTGSGTYDDKLISSIHNWLSDDEIKVKKLVEDFSKCQHLTLVVYDRARFWDNLRAKFKGIKTTPTVIIGKYRLSANITLDQLQKVL